LSLWLLTFGSFRELFDKQHLSPATYKTGIKISDEDFGKINIAHADFHGEWNYTISTSL
jgi:hypothetical protein